MIETELSTKNYPVHDKHVMKGQNNDTQIRDESVLNGIYGFCVL